MARRIGGWNPHLYFEREASADQVIFVPPKGGCGILLVFALSSILLTAAVPILRESESTGCGLGLLIGGAFFLLTGSTHFFRQRALVVEIRTSHLQLLVRSPFHSRRIEIPFEDLREIEVRKGTDVLYASQLAVAVNVAGGRTIPLGSGRPQQAEQLAGRLSLLTGRPIVHL